jgi:hypothetical protein
MPLGPVTPKATRAGPPKTPKPARILVLDPEFADSNIPASRLPQPGFHSKIPSKSVQPESRNLVAPSSPPQSSEGNIVSILKTPTAPKTPKSFTPFSKQKPKSKLFTFDKIYLPTATQKELYNDVEQYIQDAVSGYNATIFAYGYVLFFI